jgi:hypothetical protein
VILTGRGTDRLRARDPGFDGARRAARAAIAIPVAVLIGYLVAIGPLTPIFTLLGSIALLIIADFPGSTATRALAYAGLGLNGAVLIVLGTWVAPYPVAAVALCLVVGAVLNFLGLLSEITAAGQRALVMTFLLPLCVPAGPLPERLLGWGVALVVCVPAALLLFPPRYTIELRVLAARVCRALADRIAGSGSAGEVEEAMDTLRREFSASAFRPIALSAGSRSLIRIVAQLQWLCGRIDDDAGRLLGPLAGHCVVVLRGSAEVLTAPSAKGAARLAVVVAEHREDAFAEYRTHIHVILDEADEAAAVDSGRMLLRRRTISATVGLTGSIIASATTIDTRPVWARLLGRGLPETGFADRVPGRAAALRSLGGYLRTGSATVLGSLRTGTALALAFGLTLVVPVQNSLWVVLGALSVLRGSASATRTTGLRAVTGTTIGFLIGSAVISVVGVDPVVLWVLLPPAAFGATYILAVGSFTASQAMFTMMVLISFNMMRPIGWQVGLVRLEDILLGAAVALVVAALLWPGGVQGTLQRSIAAARRAGADYLRTAVGRVTAGASVAVDAAVAEAAREAMTAVRSYGDAAQVYQAESSGATDTALLEAADQIPRLRTAADLIVDVVPPPPGVCPRARAVLAAHTEALCARLDGSDHARPLGDMTADLVPALRADAAEGAADAGQALALVTAAANVGELELSYPASAEHR